MADPMDGIEPTPPAPAPAPTPAAAQQSDPSGGPLPPIHTMPMPPMPAVSAPPPAPATNTSDFNRPLTPPALQVSSAPPPPPQLPPITAFQYQQSPHQQSTPWQPIQISGLTPTSQPSSSSALTPSPTAPILAAVNPTSDPQQVTLPGPASLLNSNPPPSIAIPSITTIPSHSARQERKEPDHRQGQPKRRNRPAVSCIPCRARKIKCDQKKPCESCVKSKYHKGPCAYDQSRLPKEKTWPFKATQIDSRPPSPEPQPQPQQQEQQHLQSGTPDAIVNAEEGTSLPGPRYILDAPYRDSQSISSGAYGGGSASPLLPPIKNEPGASSAFSPIPRHAQHSGGPLPLSDAEGTEALRREVWMLRQQVDELTHQQQHQQQSQQQLPPRQRPLRESRPYSQNGASKTGDNRWHADQLFPLVTRAISNVIQSSIQSDDHNKAWSKLRTCAELSRKIEESQSGSITFLAFSDVGGTLPMSYRQEARRLTQAYFRTFESVYRILHVPAFRTRFEEYFDGQFDDQPDKAFIVQLQLCMAIGSVFEDASGSFRRYQERWIQEGQSWLLLFPPTNLAGLQTMCLLHLAKEVCGFGGGGGELTYKSAGSLLREAMCLGLNRDYLASMPIYQAELRRRLWVTILEMVVQSSLDTGLPPGISLTELGTSPPANYDDEQLAFSNPVPRPSGTFTQTTVLLELHRSFPVRLAIAQHLATLLNSPNTKAPAVESGSTTESLNAELTRASRALTGTLQPGYDPAGILPNRISVFQLKMAEMLVNRFFLGLNLALAVGAETVYKPLEMEIPEVRTSCGAAAGTIWRGVVSGLGNTRETGGSSGRTRTQHQQMDDFTSLVSRGSGTSYHATAMVAVLTLLMELRRQMEEEWQQRRLRRDHQHTPLPSIDRQGHLGHGTSSEANSATTTSPERDTSAESTRQEFLDLVSSAVDWTLGRIQTANGDTGAYVWMYLLCSAASEEVRALQRRWETQLHHSTSQAETNFERQRTKQIEELVEKRIVSDLNGVAGFLTGAHEDVIHQDDEFRRDIEEDAQLVARNTKPRHGLLHPGALNLAPNFPTTQQTPPNPPKLTSRGRTVSQFSKEANGNGTGTGNGSGSGSERDCEMMGRQKDGDSAALATRAADERRLWLERMTEREERQVIRFKSVFDLRNYESLLMQEWMDIMD